MQRSARGWGLVAALAVVAVFGVSVRGATAFDVTIRRTSHGIPHVQADDVASLAYGYAYAFAQDNLCVIADTYVTVNAQRSRYFGPDKSYVFQGNGAVVNNLNSDFFFQLVIDEGRIEKILEKAPPHGPSPEVREGVRGYVAGYNRYLSDVGGAANLPDPTCRGAAWVRPITVTDVYRRFYQLGLLASSGVAIDGIAEAQPPHPSLTGASESAALSPKAVAKLLARKLGKPEIGSNAVALGSDATVNGHGMLLGNPHFPWQGSERFYEAHLTIPGQLNVAGASLFGVPLILIGHTDSMAWSHTVSTAFRFTPFELTLVPGSPTTYLVDGRPEEMVPRTVTVKALGAGDTLEDRTRTLYSTRYGPMLTSLLGLPIFPWTPVRAFAIGDANAENFRYLNHFFETNQAQSAREMLDVLKRIQGIPWVNTIVADQSGEALYADVSVVPHVTNQKASRCNSELGVATFQLLGLPVLDGSRSECAWGTDADAVEPGIFGPQHLPVLFRSDYVTNSNDSYWLSNPEEPLEGFARIIGAERTARSLRTRSGLVMVQQRLAGNDDLPERKFTRLDLQRVTFANRQHAGELTRDDLLWMCASFPLGLAPSSSGPVDVSEACGVLAEWDLRDDLDSPGAILFRRFWGRASGALPSPWVNPFDADDPVNTPNTLDTRNPMVQLALGDAVNDLRNANIPMDGTLRNFQYEARGDEQIPIHGGPGSLGVFNAINATWDPKQGYADVSHGSSFVQVVSFDDTSCPDTATILTYSQSTNPESPYFADQTQMFSEKEWVKQAYCEDDIVRDLVGPPVHLEE